MKTRWTIKDIKNLTNCRVINPSDLDGVSEDKQNKYFNIKTETGGITYDSKFEAGESHKWDWMVRSGDLLKWERQVKIPITISGHFICNYKIDYILYHKNGIKEYVECKGKATADWKIKWKLFEIMMKEKEPESKLTIIWNKGKQNGK